MIQLKSEEQIKRIGEACTLTARLMEELETFIEEGMSTKDIDQYCHDFIIRHKGILPF